MTVPQKMAPPAFFHHSCKGLRNSTTSFHSNRLTTYRKGSSYIIPAPATEMGRLALTPAPFFAPDQRLTFSTNPSPSPSAPTPVLRKDAIKLMYPTLQTSKLPVSTPDA